MDEYTSVVDRTVAQVGSAAAARAVRGHGLRFVAVTCHDDVIPWLQPDWVYQPAESRFELEVASTTAPSSASKSFAARHRRGRCSLRITI